MNLNVTDVKRPADDVDCDKLADPSADSRLTLKPQVMYLKARSNFFKNSSKHMGG